MREPGFYWVKRVNEWIVCEWRATDTFIMWEYEMRFVGDSFFTEIDERRIVREEPCDDKALKIELENGKMLYMDRADYQEFIEKVSKMMF